MIRLSEHLPKKGERQKHKNVRITRPLLFTLPCFAQIWREKKKKQNSPPKRRLNHNINNRSQDDTTAHILACLSGRRSTHIYATGSFRPSSITQTTNPPLLTHDIYKVSQPPVFISPSRRLLITLCTPPASHASLTSRS